MGALVTLGCSRSGTVVVVIDTTMLAEAVEVVALPDDPSDVAAATVRTLPAPADSISRLRMLDDSAAVIDARFRSLRDAVNNDVTALDTADRRTRSYAVRYAAVRRRTAEAERLRAMRDSLRQRGEDLRARLGPRAGDSRTSPTEEARAGSRTIDRSAERRPMRDGAATLSLAAGRWWVGVARPGAEPARYDSLTVRRGETDTIRVRASPRPGGS